jgi:hypothetical protein
MGGHVEHGAEGTKEHVTSVMLRSLEITTEGPALLLLKEGLTCSRQQLSSVLLICFSHFLSHFSPNTYLEFKL